MTTPFDTALNARIASALDNCRLELLRRDTTPYPIPSTRNDLLNGTLAHVYNCVDPIKHELLRVIAQGFYPLSIIA